MTRQQNTPHGDGACDESGLLLISSHLKRGVSATQKIDVGRHVLFASKILGPSSGHGIESVGQTCERWMSLLLLKNKIKWREHAQNGDPGVDGIITGVRSIDIYTCGTQTVLPVERWGLEHRWVRGWTV